MKSARAYYNKYRDVQKLKQRQRRKRLRDGALVRFGNRCSRCGFSDVRALQFHHVSGGGRQHRMKLNGHLQAIYKAVIETFGPLQYDLLCANCNTIHAYENGEFANGLGKTRFGN